MLADAGSSLEQAEIIAGSAVSDGGGISIVGLHVDGADHSAFVEIAIALVLRNEFDSPESEAYQLGGKDVLRVTDAEGSAFSQPAYVYGVGETVWILFGQDEYMDALLATMP
jgi:protein involved in polysaccharide export with SLBB domain